MSNRFNHYFGVKINLPLRLPVISLIFICRYCLVSIHKRPKLSFYFVLIKLLKVEKCIFSFRTITSVQQGEHSLVEWNSVFSFIPLHTDTNTKHTLTQSVNIFLWGKFSLIGFKWLFFLFVRLWKEKMSFYQHLMSSFISFQWNEWGFLHVFFMLGLIKHSLEGSCSEATLFKLYLVIQEGNMLMKHLDWQSVWYIHSWRITGLLGVF